MTDGHRHRVVQWATGNIGLRSLRAVIEHPQLELVGVYVYSESKVGTDAGALCGLEPVGVFATRDVEEIIALRPDCVLYMGDRSDLELLCRLLASGANVVTTRSDFSRPDSIPSEIRRRLEDACRQGNATLHSTGSSPGFITEALPIVLTSLQRRLDLLTIDEFADLSSRDSPELLFALMGFGTKTETFDPGRWSHGAVSFGPSLSILADAIGLPLDEVQATGEVAVATQRVEIAAGVIEAGTVAAQRLIVTGYHKGKPLLMFRANWYCSSDIEPAWPLQDSGWRLRVAGDTPLDVTISFPVPPEDYAATTPGLTAHRPVNAIPVVVAAEPGIRTICDLPQVVAALGR